MELKELLPEFPDPNQDLEIGETYRLDSRFLHSIINKICTSEKMSIFLRERGIEIYGPYIECNGSITASRPYGMIVDGQVIKKPAPQNYLITFNLKPEHSEGLYQKHNLVETLREFII